MSGQSMMKILVIACAVAVVALMLQSMLRLFALPSGLSGSEIFFFVRGHELALAILATSLMERLRRRWETGETSGFLLHQVYTLFFMLFGFEHMSLFRSDMKVMDLFLALLLFAVALLGVITYYKKHRESFRKE